MHFGVMLLLCGPSDEDVANVANDAIQACCDLLCQPFLEVLGSETEFEEVWSLSACLNCFQQVARLTFPCTLTGSTVSCPRRFSL